MDLNYFDISTMNAALSGARDLLDSFAPFVAFCVAVAVIGGAVAVYARAGEGRPAAAVGSGSRAALGSAVGRGRWVEHRREQRKINKRAKSYEQARIKAAFQEDRGEGAYMGPAFGEHHWKD